MDKLKQLINDAQVAHGRLTARERKLLMIAGGAVLTFILFLIVFSFASSASGYRKRTDTKLKQLQEVQALAATFAQADAQRKEVERELQSNNLRLGAYIEEKGNAIGLVIPSMSNAGPFAVGDGKITETTVDFNLNDITLRRLTDFLTSIETPQVKVKYIRIEPKLSAETLTARINVATYQMKAQ
ncbi:MAG: type II secretion system protein GspM [Myxococcaceae bacterium]